MQPPPGRAASRLRMLARITECGWGTWIRTKTNRVRVCCATVTPFPNGFPNKFNILVRCSEAECELKRKSAYLASRPSIRSRRDLARGLGRAVICGCGTGHSDAGRALVGAAAMMAIRCTHDANRGSVACFQLPIFEARSVVYLDKRLSSALR